MSSKQVETSKIAPCLPSCCVEMTNSSCIPSQDRPGQTYPPVDFTKKIKPSKSPRWHLKTKKKGISIQMNGVDKKGKKIFPVHLDFLDGDHFFNAA